MLFQLNCCCFIFKSKAFLFFMFFFFQNKHFNTLKGKELELMNEKKLERGDKNAWHLWRISMAEQFNVDVIIKLGGCAVTDKRNFETVKYEAIEACAKVVKRINGKCIVVHGAG